MIPRIVTINEKKLVVKYNKAELNINDAKYSKMINNI